MSMETPTKIKKTTPPRAATMSDIARTLGLTTATVSCALGDKGRVALQTRQAVKEAAREMGFRPNPHAARLKAGRCSDTISLFTSNLDFGVGTRKLQILQTLLTQHGYWALTHVCSGEYLHPDAEFHATAMSNIRLQRPLGIICSTAEMQDSTDALRELQLYREEGGFVVTYDAPASLDIGCDQVLFDREHNTYTATKHLLELGHCSIVFYGGWENSRSERLQGYTRALREFGVAPHAKWILPGAKVRAQSLHQAGPQFNEEIGARLAELFLALRPRPTAACIVNDTVATAFLTGLLRRGVRVPEEVSIVGQDNLPVAEYSSFVPLTTVSQPLEAIANHAVEMMMERIEGKASGAARRISLAGELVLRRSTAPAP